MKILNILLLVCSLAGSMLANSLNKDARYVDLVSQTEDKIVATINKNTTQQQLADLAAYFKEYDIELDISEVNYNEQNEIIGIKVVLQKGNQKSNYAMSSNRPIGDLELGSEGGRLFITSENGNGMAMSFGSGSIADLMKQFSGQSMDLDSLLNENQFSFSFNNQDLRNLLNGDGFDLDALQQHFFGNVKSNVKKPSNESDSKSGISKLPKYNFIDSPNVNKLIIIDGKEANFKQLNELAKADQLNEVDYLKPATAISLYGDKAKDGVIIATTITK